MAWKPQTWAREVAAVAASRLGSGRLAGARQGEAAPAESWDWVPGSRCLCTRQDARTWLCWLPPPGPVLGSNPLSQLCFPTTCGSRPEKVSDLVLTYPGSPQSPPAWNSHCPLRAPSVLPFLASSSLRMCSLASPARVVLHCILFTLPYSPWDGRLSPEVGLPIWTEHQFALPNS